MAANDRGRAAMTRRYPDFSRPLRRPLGWQDSGFFLGALLFGLLVVLGIYLIAAPYARAHDWYPPACCSGGDCGPLDSSRIEREGVDYVIDHRWHVQRSSTTPSPDGRFHGCWPDKDKPPVCVFAPPDGM